MRVLCVRSSFSKNNKVVLVKRGCYYNVTKIKKDTYHNDEQCDIWYVLLEIVVRPAFSAGLPG